MAQGNLKFTHVKGDTFKEVTFQVKVNTVAVDLTGATIRMQLRKKPDDITAALSLTSVASAGITITSAATGQFKINAQIINIEVGTYSYDIEIAYASGVVSTYVAGTFTITPEITR